MKNHATLITATVIVLGVRIAHAQPVLVYEYDAESGTTPQAAGFVTFGPLTSTLASSQGVPGLGDAVIQVHCAGSHGSLVRDLTGLMAPDSPFRFAATVRHRQTLPQNSTDSCAVVRNRAGGAPGLPQALPATANGQWYRLEAMRRPGASNFVGARWRINHLTGQEFLEGTWSAPFLNSGSPGSLGSDAIPNSIAMVCANDGSTSILGEFDNLRMETVDCAADYDLSGAVTVQDIFTFLAAYFAGDARADFDSSADASGSGALGVQDIFDFLAAYFAGCS